MCDHEIQTKYEHYEEILDLIEKELKNRGVYVPEDVQEVIDDVRDEYIGS